MSLALDPSGQVLAGTDPEGILYRLADDGTAFGLFDSDLPEIRSVAVSGDGAIYFAAMGGGMDRLLQAIPAGQAAVSVQTTSTVTTSATPQVGSTVTYAQPQVTYAGERAALMRLRDGQAVEKLWSSNEENILGLVVRDGTDPGALFATDQEGRIYATGKDRQLSLLSQTGRAQMTVLSQSADGILVGSAHGGALYRLGDAAADSGHYDSVPFDTSGVSRWGRLSWRGDAPEQAAIEIQTRSGNTYRPDTSWSEWSDPLDDMSGSPVPSPSARFLQWRVTPEGRGAPGLPAGALPSAELGARGEVRKRRSGDSAGVQLVLLAILQHIQQLQHHGLGLRDRPPHPARQASSQRLPVRCASWRSSGAPRIRTGTSCVPRFHSEGKGRPTGRAFATTCRATGSRSRATRSLTGTTSFECGSTTARPMLPSERWKPSGSAAPSLSTRRRRGSANCRTALEESCGSKSRTRSRRSAPRNSLWMRETGTRCCPMTASLILGRKRSRYRSKGLEPGEHLVVLRVRDRVGNAALAKSLRP